MEDKDDCGGRHQPCFLLKSVMKKLMEGDTVVLSANCLGMENGKFYVLIHSSCKLIFVFLGHFVHKNWP